MQKTLLAVLVVLPSIVHAGHGFGHGHHGPRGAGVLAAALVAALGYWVLRYAAKDQGAVRRAGQTVGWSFVVVGLLGFLAGAWMKVKSFCPSKGGCPFEAGMAGVQPGMPLPPGHPDMPEPPRPPRRK